MRGGLAQVNVMNSVLMGGMTGSAFADAATFTPENLERLREVACDVLLLDLSLPGDRRMTVAGRVAMGDMSPFALAFWRWLVAAEACTRMLVSGWPAGRAQTPAYWEVSCRLARLK